MSEKTAAFNERDVQASAVPRSPLRVMNVLEELASEPRGLLLVRLCERLDTPKTTVLSLLRALEETKYVVKNKGLYRLGEASLRLSSLIAASFPFPHSVQDHLMDLMTRCGETALLATLSEDGQAAVYIDKIECQRPIRFSSFIGARRPLHCTGIGKALLAFQDQAFISHFLKYGKFEPFGAATIPERGALERELVRIREEGISTEMHEALGVGVIASPVFDGTGNVCAAVSIGGPIDRVRANKEDYAAEVLEAAQKMSLLLGWKHGRPRLAEAKSSGVAA